MNIQNAANNYKLPVFSVQFDGLVSGSMDTNEAYTQERTTWIDTKAEIRGGVQIFGGSFSTNRHRWDKLHH